MMNLIVLDNELGSWMMTSASDSGRLEFFRSMLYMRHSVCFISMRTPHAMQIGTSSMDIR
jgi:hypothetical protein